MGWLRYERLRFKDEERRWSPSYVQRLEKQDTEHDEKLYKARQYRWYPKENAYQHINKRRVAQFSPMSRRGTYPASSLFLFLASQASRAHSTTLPNTPFFTTFSISNSF
jgi:hypothetical protein